jgi:diaminopimelate epimerase
VHARVRDDGLVSVDMGVPNFDPRSLPMAPPPSRSYALKIDGADIEIGACRWAIRTRCCGLRRENRAGRVLGPSIEHHPRFPKRANVGFMQIVDRGHIRLRVFERGVGETLACGTGACAAVAVGRRQGLLDAEVRVDLPGGTAMVSWAGAGEHCG